MAWLGSLATSLSVRHGARWGRARASSRGRASGAGLTLVEMLVVLAIVALLLTGVLLGSGQLAGARLKKSATSLAGAIRVAFARASSTSKSVRLVFDFSERAFWMEESEQPMLVTPKDVSASGGAEAVTALEQQARAESERLVKGPTAPRARFRRVSMGLLAVDSDSKGDARVLPSGIGFRSIQTTHDADARSSDRAYLYFWPGGQTERAAIQLHIGTSTADVDTLTLVVAPLTGSVTVKAGAAALVIPRDDGEASDREDRGS
jgi:general secretion pathway protein H